jgi:hypothetical protein
MGACKPDPGAEVKAAPMAEGRRASPQSMAVTPRQAAGGGYSG